MCFFTSRIYCDKDVQRRVSGVILYGKSTFPTSKRKAYLLARSHFSFEKRRKELEKKKKKEAKKLAKAERKAALEAGEEIPEPVIVIDEFGNAVEVLPEVEAEAESEDEDENSEEPDPV